MKASSILLAAMTVAGLAACGSGTHITNGAGSDDAGRSASGTTANAAVNRTAAAARPDSDGDRDNPIYSYYDADDNEILAYGQAATASDRDAAARVVEPYFQAARAEDGARVCSLTYRRLADSIPEEYSSAPALRGNTCAAVMSKVLRLEHSRLVQMEGSLQVTGMRTEGERAYLLLGHKGNPERFVQLHRQSGSWRVNDMLGAGLP